MRSRPMDKLRILCLHGYHGSAATLRAQMRPWAESLDALADFVAVDTPALAERDHGWWHARQGQCEGWARTQDFLGAFATREGPFDGIFGFSQGAAVAALLAGA